MMAKENLVKAIGKILKAATKLDFLLTNKNKLAKELNVWPWKVDDGLLWGCPAKKIRSEWIFDLEKMKNWLATGKIKKNE
jgi:hypothetical protein